ncbi:Inner membrane ABC transporter permease protein YcjO [Sodalis praecaptivus]|uniref:carbohydrate ABC transporter permease n=1 Tax=Sodalis praecaptivus TaxID=1239307 RepID=UPI0027FA0346|nr:sugar ABC transporter permease [Sodalis praecaptivus]CAJ0997547.1 Inner membrane ABC transporter permease protein YcjO [Sodalis praecaptivus]
MAMSIEANVAAKPSRKSQLRRLLGGEAARGLALSSPIVVLMLALVFVPFVVTLWESFHRVNPMLPGTPFVGIKNYVQMFKDGQVHSAWINTWIYVILAVVIEILGGLGAALLLNKVKTGRRWLLAAVILPWALPPVVNAIIWSWINNPHYGLLNGLLLKTGLIEQSHVWLNDRATALFLIVLVHVWRMMPLNAVIILAALQTIPNELYEAAKVDGASPLRTFRMITLPLIGGAFGIALTQSTITAFNLFDEAWILTGSSAATRPIQSQIYMTAFQNLNFSYGMAMSITVMLVSIIVSAVYVRRVYRATRYD